VTGLSGVAVATDEARRPWLTFEGDGQVFGSGGVNRLRGTWSIDGDSLTFGPLASTLMAGPQEAMDVEYALHRLLGQPLTLHTADGASATSADPTLDAAATSPVASVELVAGSGAAVVLARISRPPGE